MRTTNRQNLSKIGANTMKDKFKIETFILREPILDFMDFEENPNKYLVSINYQKEEAEKILKKLASKVETDDLLYVDGVVFMEYQGQTIIPYIYWDEISALWPYVVNLIEDFITTGEGLYYFPGQPIEMKLSQKDNGIVFSVDNKKMFMDKHYFLTKVITAAVDYFDFINSTLGNQESFESQRVKKLLEKIS